MNTFFTQYESFKKKMRYCLLIALLVLSFSRGFSDANPMDHKLLHIYHDIQEDSKLYSRVYAASFTKNEVRERFFTVKDLCCPDRQVLLKDIFEGFFQNLHVFDGDYDACYFFLEIHRDEIPFFEQKMNDLKTAGLTVFDECWNNEHQKKKSVVLKYIPNAKSFALSNGELISNGDFQGALPVDKQEKIVENLARRGHRFLSDNPVLPLNWNIYQSLTTKSDVFATVTTRNNHSFLRMEAPDSYIVAISPWFRTDDKSYLGFDVFASAESELQLSRQIRYNSGGNELYPVTVLKLEPESTRHYSIKLKNQPDEINTNIWFWLKDGNVEISNVRIECQTND